MASISPRLIDAFLAEKHAKYLTRSIQVIYTVGNQCYKMKQYIYFCFRFFRVVSVLLWTVPV